MSGDGDGDGGDSSSKGNASPITYAVIPLVAVFSIAFIAVVLYYRRRRYLRNGGTDYTEWPQDRFMAADGNLLHYPGGRHMTNFTASISAANSIEAARRANALRYNSGFGFGNQSQDRHGRYNHSRVAADSRPLPLPRWSFWGAMRSTEGLNELGEAPPPYDTKRKLAAQSTGQQGGGNNPESDAERGQAGTEARADADADANANENADAALSLQETTETSNDTSSSSNNTSNTTLTRWADLPPSTHRYYPPETFSTRGRRSRHRQSSSTNNNTTNNNNSNANDDTPDSTTAEENTSTTRNRIFAQPRSPSRSRSRSRTPCRCRSTTRESFESAMALQDWLIPRVTDMNEGAMPPGYITQPEPAVTAAPREQPDVPSDPPPGYRASR